MELEKIAKGLDSVEQALKTMAEKAEGQARENGKVSADTTAAIDAVGVKQLELADRLAQLEQKGFAPAQVAGVDSLGDQLVKADALKNYQSGQSTKCRVELKNTIVGADATVAPDRKPGVVPGAAPMLTLEAFLNASPTSSNAIEFTKELAFTNNAVEVAEGGAKTESAITFSLVSMPISTVAHWLKISKQLAGDNAALAAYVNNRMIYGVNRKVETQLVSGTGVAPIISGILNAGNFTAHGYANADLGATLKKVVLIRKMMAASHNAGYPADAVLLNPVDWAAIEIDLLTTAAGQTLLSYNDAGQPRLWGLPVIQSVGMTLDNVAVGAFRMAYTVHNREGVVVELSDSDSDNFTKNLVTIRAERRLALATEVPAAVRAGDLTPA